MLIKIRETPMFGKPIQYVTVDTISSLGLNSNFSISNEKRNNEEEEIYNNFHTTPFSFSLINTNISSSKPTMDENNDDSNKIINHQKFRGDQLLWIE